MLRTQQDRAEILLRVGTPADAERVRAFVAGLSLRSQFFRFFASVATPSSSLLRSLTGADGRADVLIAVDAAGCVVGHGMVVDRAGGDGRCVSDIGVVVDDGWQGRGVGSALLRALARRAADRGSAELVMDVLPENNRMLGMIDRRWPQARRSRNRDSVTIRASLTTSAHAAVPAPAIPGRAVPAPAVPAPAVQAPAVQAPAVQAPAG